MVRSLRYSVVLAIALLALTVLTPERASETTSSASVSAHLTLYQPPRNKQIEELITQLGDESSQVRQRAETELFEIGTPALRYLYPVIRNTENEEVRSDAKLIVRRIIFADGFFSTVGTGFVYMQPGEFVMGSPETEVDRRGNELQHTVRMTCPFFIARHEVTQNEFYKVMDQRPSWFSSTGEGQDKVGRKQTGNFPVDSVTWFDAIEFCNRLSKLHDSAPYYSLTDVERKGKAIVSAKVKILGGTGYRLPTEAEWEYACRAGTKTSHHFGTLPKKSSRSNRGNFKYSVMTRSYGLGYHTLHRTTKVGDYTPNAWKIHDMHGNVAEWCWDWYDESYYSESPKADPIGPDSGDHRVLRGGSFLATQPNCRSATRFWSLPGETKFYIGFRLARSAPTRKNVESED